MKSKKVKFKLNKSLDKKMALDFLQIKQGGVDFSNGIIGVHPELECLEKIKTRKEQAKIINEHFDRFYRKHRNYLAKRIREFDSEWSSVENKFFKETDKIFKGKDSDKNTYCCYLSVIDCNPRFLEDRVFQVFYFHPQGVKYVASHEIMHFLFYEYAVKNKPKIFKKLDTEKGIFWDLAEIFNVIILSSPEFKKIHGVKNIVCYPEHEKYLNYLKRLWFKNDDINEWLTKGFSYLKNNEK